MQSRGAAVGTRLPPGTAQTPGSVRCSVVTPAGLPWEELELPGLSEIQSGQQGEKIPLTLQCKEGAH